MIHDTCQKTSGHLLKEMKQMREGILVIRDKFLELVGKGLPPAKTGGPA